MPLESAKKDPVVIIGAGICGLLLAQRLKAQQVPVLILEKSRGVGGRFATRRTDDGVVDHGISALEMTSEAVTEWARDLIRQGVLTRSPTSPQKWIHPRGMNQIAKHLADGLLIERNRRVTRITPVGEQKVWSVECEDLPRPFTASAVVCTQPAPQSLELLRHSRPGQFPECEKVLETVHYRSTLVLIANVPKGTPRALMAKPPFESVVLSAEKGLAESAGAVAVFLDAEFSRDWFERADDEILNEGLARFRSAFGLALSSPQLKKWRYSQVESARPEPFLSASSVPPLYFGGDGFAGGQIEGALLSARALADQIAAQ